MNRRSSIGLLLHPCIGHNQEDPRRKETKSQENNHRLLVLRSYEVVFILRLSVGDAIKRVTMSGPASEEIRRMVKMSCLQKMVQMSCLQFMVKMCSLQKMLQICGNGLKWKFKFQKMQRCPRSFISNHKSFMRILVTM